MKLESIGNGNKGSLNTLTMKDHWTRTTTSVIFQVAVILDDSRLRKHIKINWLKKVELSQSRLNSISRSSSPLEIHLSIVCYQSGLSYKGRLNISDVPTKNWSFISKRTNFIFQFDSSCFSLIVRSELMIIMITILMRDFLSGLLYYCVVSVRPQ